jgi:predicted alpha/beta hydrolase
VVDRSEIATGPPVVLIAPAMAIGSHYYRPLVEEFARRGWEARALGRRGFERGAARASRRSDWTYRDEIDDIAVAVAAARSEDPDRPVLVLGHSLGGQLVAGHELVHAPVDGVITVGGAIPYHRHFPHGGLPLAAMAAVIVPVTTTILGYVPKPAFGGPGARTFMRDWARMVLTGRPPFPVDRQIDTPALIVSLDEDGLSPRRAVDDLAALFEPGAIARWHYTTDEVPPGASNDHITWVRTPEPVVDRVVSWWEQVRAGTVAAG